MRRLFRGLGRNVIGLGAASFFTDLASEMITPLIPIFLSKELKAGRAILGLIEGVSDSVASLLRLISGWLSDRLRKRKILIFVGYGFSVVMRPLMAVVGTAWHLGLLRLIDRVGKGIRLAPRDALIADSCEPAARGKAFGFQRMMDNLGGVLGMLIAAALLLHFAGHYRKIFLLTAIPASCVLLVIALVLRDRPSTAPPAKLRLSLRPFGFEFRWFLLTVVVFTLGNSSDLFIIARLSHVGMQDHWVVLIWCGHTAIRMLAALPAGMLADRFGKKRLVFVGWLLYAGVYAGLAFASSAASLMALLAAYALYWSLAESVLRAVVADLVPEELRGTAYGLYHFCVGIAILPANLLFGLLWDRVSAPAAFLTGAGLAALACLLWLRLRRPTSLRPAAP